MTTDVNPSMGFNDLLGVRKVVEERNKKETKKKV
jgi:hypothetical protein